MVFSSNKNGSDGINAAVEKSKAVAKTGGGKKKNKKQSKLNDEAADDDDGYTSGRYGIGLTLCLLHAQHLVPGSVTCITSTTSTSEHWIRSIYQVDMDADRVTCKKREELVKESVGECGTIVSLLVPVSNIRLLFLWIANDTHVVDHIPRRATGRGRSTKVMAPSSRIFC
jgi:hypothetical protein